MKIFHMIISLLVIVDTYGLSRVDDNLDAMLVKRPFCNAFTGCGRKRDPSYSVPSNNNNNNDYRTLTMPMLRILLRIAAANRNNLNNNNNNNNNLPLDNNEVRQIMRTRNDAQQLQQHQQQVPLRGIGPF